MSESTIRAEKFLLAAEMAGLLMSAPGGTLTFCGPDMESIGRARGAIAAAGIEEELVELLRPEDPRGQFAACVRWVGRKGDDIPGRG
jgi:hypothetical protein